MVSHWRQNKTRTQKWRPPWDDVCWSMLGIGAAPNITSDILSLRHNVDPQWLGRATSRSILLRVSWTTVCTAKCHISGAQRSTVEADAMLQNVMQNLWVWHGLLANLHHKWVFFMVHLLTTILDVGNLNSDSQPVQKRFLGGNLGKNNCALFFCQTLDQLPTCIHSSSCQQAPGIYSILMGLQVGSVMISSTYRDRKQPPQESWRNMEEPLKFRTNFFWWQLRYCLLLFLTYESAQSTML